MTAWGAVTSPPYIYNGNMNTILQLKNITKRYAGVVALRNVDFELGKGEVRALLGKNGAGKSTLVKVLSGAVRQDEGTIYVDNKQVSITNPKNAFEIGISTVYQEMSLVPELSVAENILLGRWDKKGKIGIIDLKRIHEKARQSTEQIKVELDLGKTVSQLSVAEQQLTEIAKAISYNPRVLILDEPTSALPSEEVEIVHNVVRNLAKQGHSIIYVTHRLQELPFVADSVTVLRDGQNIGTIPVNEASPSKIANMMIGEDWQSVSLEHRTQFEEEKLKVSGLKRDGVLHDISFSVRGGEILGIAGLLGSGRTELVRTIFGSDPIDGGTIEVGGKAVTNPNPRLMKKLGVGMTPEDRRSQGFIPVFSVEKNLSLASLGRISKGGFLSHFAERTIADKMVHDIQIKTASLDIETETLSGGNQQKVVLGNWLNTRPEVLIMDEPTRGIDIHAKEQIFKIIKNLSEQGIAILFISSEIEEVLDVSDRILVMSQGRITHEVNPEEVNLEKLMELVMEEFINVEST